MAMLVVAACASTEDDAALARVQQPLRVECVDAADAAPDTGWVCPESKVVECSDPAGTDVSLIFSEPPQDEQCADVALSVAPEGPFALGSHTIEISSNLDGGALLCEATLTVVDTTAPSVTPKHVEMWPPNHKFQSLGANDCFEIADACDADIEAVLLWATSDEPLDDTGDGNTEPDIQFVGCDQVQLRAERKGNGSGRVYRMGWRFSDDSGNSTESTCEVLVPHDQGKHEAFADPPVVELSNEVSCRPDAG
jgi:hypothetical protein